MVFDWCFGFFFIVGSEKKCGGECSDCCYG